MVLVLISCQILHLGAVGLKSDGTTGQTTGHL